MDTDGDGIDDIIDNCIEVPIQTSATPTAMGLVMPAIALILPMT